MDNSNILSIGAVIAACLVPVLLRWLDNRGPKAQADAIATGIKAQNEVIKNLRAEVDRTHDQNVQLQASVENIDKQNARLQAEVDDLRRIIERMEAAVEAEKKIRAELEQINERYSKALAAAKIETEQKHGELQRAIDLARYWEGLYNRTKQLYQQVTDEQLPDEPPPPGDAPEN